MNDECQSISIVFVTTVVKRADKNSQKRLALARNSLHGLYVTSLEVHAGILE